MAFAQVLRVRLRSYRSIKSCDVWLGPRTFLVGPNGSGKSNFLDSLRLVADALNSSLDQALRERGGIEVVRRISTGHPNHVHVDITLMIDQWLADYGFEVGARKGGGFEVVRETCSVKAGSGSASFEVGAGQVTSTEPVLPLFGRDRLYLVTAASLPAFRPVFDALARMGFYNLNPDVIRDLQTPDAGELLARDGRNIASVLDRLVQEAPVAKHVIEEYLAAVVPGLVGVDRRALGPRETLEFRQRVAGAQRPWRFSAQSMSDGTLRALGILVAIFQGSSSNGPTLIGIEEPEIAVHPAAAAVLSEALGEASRSRQVIVTSHSPELLDDPDIPFGAVVAVRSDDGVTTLGRLDRAGREALQKHLYTAGELLRLNQLTPDPDAGHETPDRVTA
jgi:predicted ATPase